MEHVSKYVPVAFEAGTENAFAKWPSRFAVTAESAAHRMFSPTPNNTDFLNVFQQVNNWFSFQLHIKNL